MKVRVLSVGRRGAHVFEEATRLYAERLRHYLDLELVDLAPSRARARGVALREEGRALLAARGKGRLVALDAGGRSYDSPGLARHLEGWRASGQGVTLVIGGDEGLDATVLEAADERLSLGPLTLPHRLARLVLLEQLYRASTILRGEPYHK